MAMTMDGEVRPPASRSIVWVKLNDPAVLKARIPGCEKRRARGGNKFEAVARMKISLVFARFRGGATLSDLDSTNGYGISGQGEGGVAGFAKGGAIFAPADAEGGTLLRYGVEARNGGKIAQLGQWLIAGSAEKLAEGFFAKFGENVSAGRIAVERS